MAVVLDQAREALSYENASLCILRRLRRIEYIMRKIIRLICACLCICALMFGVFAVFFSGEEGEAEADGVKVLTLWQIDGFEGGKGSRAEYLKRAASEFGNGGVYIDVVSVSSRAASINIKNGCLPDILSYGAGFCGIESAIYGEAVSWCNGAYCVISLDGENFEEATSENTVVNGGRENFASVAALLCGLGDADVLAPVSAYAALLDGRYKFLLGTQRDIHRLKSRDVGFFVKPLVCYNDLFQYIVPMRGAAENRSVAEQFIEFLLGRSGSLTAIGMTKLGESLYDDEMHALETVDYRFSLPAVMDESAVNEIGKAVKERNINLLKSLLKPL